MLQKEPTRSLGNKAEDYACQLLVQNSYKIIERNFHSRFGEVDIIATKDNTLFFVEVKARWNNKFGLPEEAVTPTKLWKIQKTAEYYASINKNLPQKMQILVVALEIVGTSAKSAKIIDVF